MLALITRKGRSGSFHGGRASLGKGPATKSDEFWKSAKGGEGGGVISNPKIYIVDVGSFKQGFLSRNLYKKVISRFRIHFPTIVLRKIKTRHTLKKEAISYYLALISSCIYAAIPIIKKTMQYNFPKMGGGVKCRLEFLQKIIQFGSRTLPLPMGAV